MNACRTCAHWRTVPIAGVEHVSGRCSRILEQVSMAGSIAQPGALVTPAEFGCKLHSTPGTPGSVHAHARRGDPEESHAAARSIENLTERRRDVLCVLGEASAPLADVELAQHYERFVQVGLGGWREIQRQSASGIRTRRAELVSMGLVARTGSTVIGGRKHATWWPTDAGRAQIAG